MPFNSFLFLLGFLPLTIAVYAAAGRLGHHSAHYWGQRWGHRWAKAWLIVASLLFYGLAAPRFLPLLLLSVGGNLLLLRVMAVSDTRAWLAAFGCVANLGLLAWFKYGAAIGLSESPLPLGISFFTFAQIGCLLAFAASGDPPPSAGTYSLFVLFFPALTAGPILNAREMLPRFARTTGWQLSANDLAIGLGFFLVGLLKKSVLADPLSETVLAGFADPAALTLLPAWQAATSWSLQLYFDFSGYSDMAIGLAWIFGFRFPDNFDQPYRARSVIEYWQRWHMSLTRFLMANVHAPLTLAILRWRRRRGLPISQTAQRTLSGFASMFGAPILLTMVLAGLWHGPALTYLLFGLLHGLFLLVAHAWRLWRRPSPSPLLAAALTYLCILAGAVVFRADTVSAAVQMLAAMAGCHGATLPSADPRGVSGALWLLALYGIVWFAPTTRQVMEGRTRLSWRASPAWAVVMGCCATLGLLASGGTGEFVYFRF